MVSVTRESDKTRTLTHKDEKCVGCGICSDICPTNSVQLGAIVPIARGILQMDKVNLDEKTCCLCGLCASACPFDALEFKIDGISAKDIPEYPKWAHDAEINDELCLLCSRCQKACPADALFK